MAYGFEVGRMKVSSPARAQQQVGWGVGVCVCVCVCVCVIVGVKGLPSPGRHVLFLLDSEDQKWSFY